MKSKKFIIATVVTSVIGAGAFATAVMAAHPPGGIGVPGWGHGDTNHVHTGPPGQSVRVTNSNSINVSNSTSQTSVSGSATVTGNTSGGNARSGSASNSSTTSTSVNVSNSTSF